MIPQPTEDAALARRIATGGDREAEALLCARFARPVRVFARRLLRDDELANDLAQDALLVVLESLRRDRVTDPERLGAFVLGTCRRLASDVRRTRRRREELVARYGGDLVDVTTAALAPGDLMADAARLERCLERLGVQDRAVVVLTFYGDKSGPEIAAELGISPANVRVVRHRALARLHECIDGHAGGAP